MLRWLSRWFRVRIYQPSPFDVVAAVRRGHSRPGEIARYVQDTHRISPMVFGKADARRLAEILVSHGRLTRLGTWPDGYALPGEVDLSGDDALTEIFRRWSQ